MFVTDAVRKTKLSYLPSAVFEKASRAEQTTGTNIQIEQHCYESTDRNDDEEVL